MSVSKSVTTTIDNSDSSIAITFSLPPGGVVPTDIKVVLLATKPNTPQLPPTDVVTACGAAITPAQLGTALRAIMGNILTANGYA